MLTTKQEKRGNWNVILVAALAAGCHSESPGSANSAIPPAMTVERGSQEYAGNSPAELKLSRGSEPRSELTISANAGDRVWSAFGVLSQADVDGSQRDFTFQVTEGMAEEAKGTVADGVFGSTALATSGTVTFSLVGGKITGQFVGVPSDLNATFEGELSVTCLVPADSATEQGEVGGGPVRENLVEDKELSTTACSPYKRFLSP